MDKIKDIISKLTLEEKCELCAQADGYFGRVDNCNGSMNVMIIDDRIDVAESLKVSINWDKIGAKNVFIGNSADCARTILSNHLIDILLCDIEMPGENGLDLFKWVKNHYPMIECIFLTPPAEFGYAEQALHLGADDYILQPAKASEVEDALQRACIKILHNNEFKKIRESENLFKKQKAMLADGLFLELRNYEEVDSHDILKRLTTLFEKKLSILDII